MAPFHEPQELEAAFHKIGLVVSFQISKDPDGTPWWTAVTYIDGEPYCGADPNSQPLALFDLAHNLPDAYRAQVLED